GDRVLQHVGQHDRDAIAFLELEFVQQVGTELLAQGVDLRVAEGAPHVLERRMRGEILAGHGEDVGDGAELIEIDLCRYVFRVARQPRTLDAHDRSLSLWFFDFDVANGVVARLSRYVQRLDHSPIGQGKAHARYSMQGPLG